MTPGEITERALRDGIGGNKGLCDLFSLRLDIRNFVLEHDMPCRIKVPALQAMVREALASFDGYRKFLAPLTGEPDRTWMAPLPGSARAAVNLYEELIYGHEFDASLRSATRQGMSANDIMTLPLIKQHFDDIETKAALENMPASYTPKAAAPVAALANVAAEDLDGKDDLPCQPDVLGSQWRTFAKSKIAETVNIIVDPGKSEAALSNLIKGTIIGKTVGDAAGHSLSVAIS